MVEVVHLKVVALKGVGVAQWEEAVSKGAWANKTRDKAKAKLAEKYQKLLKPQLMPMMITT